MAFTACGSVFTAGVAGGLVDGGEDEECALGALELPPQPVSAIARAAVEAARGATNGRAPRRR